jgi:hypothetical protein
VVHPPRTGLASRTLTRAPRELAIAVALLIALQVGCSRNPAFGDWEVDREQTDAGALLVVDATDLATLHFDDAGASAGETEIPGTWVVEETVTRLVRSDGRGEHRIEVLPDDRIRVELPIGVAAVYKRVGAG